MIAPAAFTLKPSGIHGVGAFAWRAIAQGERIVEYLGEKISKSESVRRCEANHQFIITLNDEYDLDGNVEWNPARFFNHSCRPNCEAVLERERIWIVALHRIEQDQELTFNYGFDLEDYRNYPCYCGAPDCVGFIVALEFFDHVRKQTSTV